MRLPLAVMVLRVLVVRPSMVTLRQALMLLVQPTARKMVAATSGSTVQVVRRLVLLVAPCS